MGISIGAGGMYALQMFTNKHPLSEDGTADTFYFKKKLPHDELRVRVEYLLRIPMVCTCSTVKEARRGVLVGRVGSVSPLCTRQPFRPCTSRVTCDIPNPKDPSKNTKDVHAGRSITLMGQSWTYLS